MIPEIAEALLGLFEFVAAAADIPIGRRRAATVVGDRFRSLRAVRCVAVLRPLTPRSERFELLVQPDAVLRVELALEVTEQPAYLAFATPVDPGTFPSVWRDRALAAGFWLEVPQAILRSQFRRINPGL